MKEKTMEQLRLDAQSVLKAWEQDNQVKVREYVTSHHWPKQDIDKLQQYIQQQKLVVVAITRHQIYGRSASGMIHSISRSLLGIGVNWSRPQENRS